MIGATTAFKQIECRCSTTELRLQFRFGQILHPLKTHNAQPELKRPNSGSSQALPQLLGHFNSTAEHRNYKDILLESWELEPDSCHPGDLEVLGGVAFSICTLNAIRCSVLSLILSSSVRRWLQRFRSSATGIAIRCWDAFWASSSDSLAKLWESNPQWQHDIALIITMCLKCLWRSGFDTPRHEYSVLWVQEARGKLGSLRLERLALSPNLINWVIFLKDSADSCAMSIPAEECFGSTAGNYQQICGATVNDPSPSRPHPSSTRLQTSLEINKAVKPFNPLSPPHASTRQPTTNGIAASSSKLNISMLAPGTNIRLLMPEYHFRIVEVLAEDHLLLEQERSLMMMISDDEIKEGHRECFDIPDEDDAPRLLVHTQAVQSQAKGKAAVGRMNGKLDD